MNEDSIVTKDLTFRTVSHNSASAIQDDKYVALRAGKYQKCAEVTDDGAILAKRTIAILAKRTIGSEYINNFNPVLLHVVR